MTETLTPKQELFCHEYIVDLNATQAAIRAGYSKRSARSVGCENLTKPNISHRIAELLAERTAQADGSADEVLEGLWDIARSNVWDHFDWQADGSLRVRDPDELTPGQRRALRSVRVKQRLERGRDGEPVVVQSLEVTLWDKLSALQVLAEYHQLIRKGAKPADDGDTEYEVTMDIPHANAERGQLFPHGDATTPTDEG